MDLRRFLDLYEAETQEHVRILQRSLLELERPAPAPRWTRRSARRTR
jgi:hypothetical protein